MKKLFLLFFTLVILTSARSQVILRSGFAIPLELSSSVSSNSAMQGQQVDLRVIYDITVDGKTVIPAGTLAKGIVRRVSKAKGAGRAGVIELQVESITINDQQIGLTSNTLLVEGENKKALAWGLTGGGFFVVGPLSFFFLLIKGESAVIQAGTKLDATLVKTVSVNQ